MSGVPGTNITNWFSICVHGFLYHMFPDMAPSCAKCKRLLDKSREKDRDSSASESRGSRGKTRAEKPSKPMKPRTSTSSRDPGGLQHTLTGSAQEAVQSVGANGSPHPREEPERLVAGTVLARRPQSQAPDAERVAEGAVLARSRPLSPAREDGQPAGPGKSGSPEPRGQPDGCADPGPRGAGKSGAEGPARRLR